jgi:diguanylate cyclase (GGDEF)-like protein
MQVLHGLQFKWTLLLAFFMLGLALGGEALIRRATGQLVARQHGLAGRERCRVLGAAARQGLLGEDPVALRAVVTPFECDQSILFVQFFSRSGEPIIQPLQRRDVQPAPPGADGPAGWLGRVRIVPEQGGVPPYLDIVSAVRLSNSPADGNRDGLLGYVRMGFDLSAAQASVGTYLQRVRYTAILAVLMIIPVAFLIVRRVTEPLQDLGSKVTQLASGDFQARADIRRRDEIGQLARLFNRMADELASKNDSLVKLNAELEDRVLQRTRQLVELASRDSLTALYNRRHLGEVLARRFAEAERYDTDLSCLMIDLDNFKKVNDQHGHALGDRLLILTANVIRSELRSSDVGARFGGDEFCVLLPQTTADRAMQLGSRIVERFQTEVKSQLGEAGTDFGISVGVAGMQELRLVHYDELMKAADQALYGAKDAGKNRIFLAESLVS